MSVSLKNQHTINRLTALWALSESGLGGIMHALKIPLTGFFVGGFAVIIVALIAHNSQRNFRIIIQSTLLVILVKAGVSPHSPVPAYIAVAFQGVAGAVIYRLIPHFRAASLLFSLLALTESAVQKFLITTLLFGKSVWEALDLFIKSMLTDFHLPHDFSFSFWLIVIYTVIYALWGLLLGLWVSRLPIQLERRSEMILMKFQLMEQIKQPVIIVKKNKKYKWNQFVLILLFIVLIYFSEGYLSKGIYVIARTIAMMLLIFVLLKPLLNLFFKHFESKKKVQITELINQLPELKSFVQPAWQLAAESHEGISKYKAFVIHLLVFVLNDTTQKNAV